jgi:hypothetical protein
VLLTLYREMPKKQKIQGKIKKVSVLNKKSTKTLKKPQMKTPVKNKKTISLKKTTKKNTGKFLKKKTVVKVKKVVAKIIKKISAQKGSKKILKKKIVKTSKKKVEDILPKEGIKLSRAYANPIIEPRLYSWESKATFNPTAFFSNGKIHLIYRAVGWDDISVLGYASSFNGYKIEERPPYHIYRRFSKTEPIGPKLDYGSGGGWSGGCEDPRITLVGDRLYMLYTAFDGWSSVRIALTSISLEDFRKHRWDKW